MIEKKMRYVNSKKKKSRKEIVTKPIVRREAISETFNSYLTLKITIEP